MIKMILNLDNDNINKIKLLQLLKSKAVKIHITHIMKACNYLIDEGKYVQPVYRKKFYDAYIKSFILRIKEIKEDKNIYSTTLDMDKFKEAITLLEEQEKMIMKIYPNDHYFTLIYQIISLYTSFILDEPIHIVGTEFPGGFKVKFDGKNYLCPVKEKQKTNPNAVCGFCIAKQDKLL